MAESLIGLYKAEVIHHLGPWRGQEGVEYATLEWVQWYNDKRLHGELDYLSLSGYEERYRQTQTESAEVA